MEFIEVVGEQVTPFQPLPEPNRRIDIYGHRIAQLVGKSRTCKNAEVAGCGRNPPTCTRLTALAGAVCQPLPFDGTASRGRLTTTGRKVILEREENAECEARPDRCAEI